MILGITGSIGGGKSLVTDFFARRGWDVFSADDFCRRMRENPEADFLRKVQAVFGNAFMDDAGALDREKIADAVFRDDEKMTEWLDLVYPALDEALDAQIASCKARNVNGAFELPLLFEKNYAPRFDAVLAVWSGDTLRHARLKEKRAFPDAEIARREARQLPENVKLEMADYAVINCAGFEMVEAQIDLLMEKIKILQEKKDFCDE